MQERSSCREALRCILGKVYQPIVVKELLILQGATQQVCEGRTAVTLVVHLWCDCSDRCVQCGSAQLSSRGQMKESEVESIFH